MPRKKKRAGAGGQTAGIFTTLTDEEKADTNVLLTEESTATDH